MDGIWLIAPGFMWVSIIGGAIALNARANRREYRQADAEIAPPVAMTAKEFMLAQTRCPDHTKDREGYYGPLPLETAEQVVARLERAAVRDWEQQWEALAGYTWQRHQDIERHLEWKRDLTRRHEEAMKHRAGVIAFEEARRFSRGGRT